MSSTLPVVQYCKTIFKNLYFELLADILIDVLCGYLYQRRFYCEPTRNCWCSIVDGQLNSLNVWQLKATAYVQKQHSLPCHARVATCTVQFTVDSFLRGPTGLFQTELDTLPVGILCQGCEIVFCTTCHKQTLEDCTVSQHIH